MDDTRTADIVLYSARFVREIHKSPVCIMHYVMAGQKDRRRRPGVLTRLPLQKPTSVCHQTNVKHFMHIGKSCNSRDRFISRATFKLLFPLGHVVFVLNIELIENHIS